MRACQPDGTGGVRVVEIPEPEEMRVEREKQEQLATLAKWLQTNGVQKLTDVAGKVSALEAKVAALESKVKP